MKRFLMILSIFTITLLAACETDNTAPVITISTEFQAIQTVGGMIQVPTATCIDDVDATCFVQTTPDPNFDADTPGVYTFTFTANDNANNVATETVTLTLEQGTPNMSAQAEILSHAIAVANATDLYCLDNTCSYPQNFTWDDISPYVAGISANLYDFTVNDGVIAVLQETETLIYMERAGTGEWEVPWGSDPTTLQLEDILVDTN